MRKDGRLQKNKSIMMAATKSGSGKTLLTCALMRAMCMRGLRVSGFKCGPDYIDPMFHRRVIGVPSGNLDLFFTDEDKTRELFEEKSDGDISVIEGVMGLYDGVGGITGQASPYHLANVLKSNIILIVDAHGMGYSLLAEIAGFLSMDSEGLIAGVILNRVSRSFYESIAPVVEERLGISVLGYFPVRKDFSLESRHLGLKLPGEVAELSGMVDAAAEQMEESVDIDRLLEIAGVSSCTQDAEPVCKDGKADTAGNDRPAVCRIGVALDDAFCFYYRENLDMLKKAGAELVYFSPCNDKTLPQDLQGLLLGGGYPELYAEKLSENKTMRSSIRSAMEHGLPTLAECGGFMYLHSSLVTKEQEEYPMVGFLPGSCFYTGHLVRFGYVSVRPGAKAGQAAQEGFLSGGEIKGHEFHYFDSTDNGDSCEAVKPVTDRRWECIHADADRFLGFAHLYYPSCPGFVEYFVDRCKRRKPWKEDL